MLQTKKRPIALLCAVMLCLSLLSGIVLPQLAETAKAVADPYLKPDGSSITGSRYQLNSEDVTTSDGKAVYTLASDVWLLVPTLGEAPADVDEAGYYYYTFGDGSTWGNGVTYAVKWNEAAAAGEETEGDYSAVSADNGNLFGKAYYYYTNKSTWIKSTVKAEFSAIEYKLRSLDPAEKNNITILLAPGAYASSTGLDGSGRAVTMNTPSGIDDPTEAEMLNVYFLGPQAGKTPVTAQGSSAVNNGRSVNTSKEAVFSNTFWLPTDSVWHFDGVAGSGALKFFSPTSTTSTAKQGMYIDNFYAEIGGKNVQLFAVGGDNYTNTRLQIFSVTNSFFNQTGTDTKSLGPVVQGNKITFDTVVFNNFKESTPDQYHQNQHIKLGPSKFSASQCNFLGDGSGKFSAVINNCSFIDWQTSHIWRAKYGNFGGDYGANGSIAVTNNWFGGTKIPQYTCDIVDLDKVATAPKTPSKLIFTDNYIEVPNADMADTSQVWRGINANSSVANAINMEIHDNTWRANFNKTNIIPYYSYAGLADYSGDLFLDFDNNVRTGVSSHTSNNRTANFSVCSDLRASQSGVGGISELFTVHETTQDLMVLNSRILLERANTTEETAPVLLGAVTVLPKDGVTYNTADLFQYTNKDVELLGFYAEFACTTPVSTIEKGFGTVYAKAQYKAGDTTCTVVYTVAEPTTYRIVDLNGVGSYTFNGDTFDSSSSNATFYSTLFDAYSAYASPSIVTATPATDVLLLMPGTYNASQYFGRSVAIVGPQFGVTPCADGQYAAQNGRGVDPTTEAVLLQKLAPQTTNGIYFALNGVAFGATEGNYGIEILNAGTVRLNFVKVSDVYFGGAGVNFVSTSAQGKQTNSASQSTITFATVTDSFFTNSNKTSRGLYTQINYLKFDSCVFSDIGAEKTSGFTEMMYWLPHSLKNVRVIPTVTGLYFTNSVFHNNNTRGVNGGIRYADSFALYNGGIDMVMDGCTFDNIKGYAVSPQPGAAKTVNLVFTNNKVTQNTASTSKIINEYVTSDAFGEYKKVDVSGNVFVNYTAPFKCYSPNSFNVDENYFGNSAGKAIKITVASPVTKADWYYLDEAMTVTSDDMALTNGGFDSVDMDAFDAWTARFSGSKASYTVSDIAAEKATVVGMYSDSECTTDKATLTKGETAYVKLSYKGVTAVWEVTIASVWATYGLEPATPGETVVVPTTAGKYMFVAPDWAAFAKDSADGELTGNTPAIGDVFYATMPTTGITYQLQYGINAANVQNINTALFETVVAFPGTYNAGTGYGTAGTGTVTENGVTTVAGFSKTLGKGAFGIGQNISYAASFKNFALLGPYAGVSPADTETGANLRDGAAYEAVLTGQNSSYLYLMNRTFADGATTVIDGIAGTATFSIVDCYGNADWFAKYNYSSEVTVKNVALTEMSDTIFKLYAYGSSVGNAKSTKNVAKAIVTLNVENCYISYQDDKTANLGSTNTDFINIRRSVFKRNNTAGQSPTGFYINPTKAANYANTNHAPAFVCEDSYIEMSHSPLFTVATSNAAASDLSTANRKSVTVAFRDNKMVNIGFNTGNYIRAAMGMAYATGAQNAAFRWEFTGNEVTNNTGAYPTLNCFIGSQSNGPAQDVKVENNTFKGYNSGFKQIGDDWDYSNNLYFGLDGTTVISVKPINGKAEDVMLGDYAHKASDFNITSIADSGAAFVTWTAGEAVDLTGTVVVPMKTGLTPDTLAVSYNSTNVQTEGIYTDADCLTPAASFEVGKTYYLRAAFKDENTFTAVYSLQITEDLTGVDVYTGANTYYDPDVSVYADGTRVKRTVLEGAEFTPHEYVFTVGTNIFGAVNDIPKDAEDIRQVYLFAKTYTGFAVTGGSADRGAKYYLHGAKENVSPVSLDENGIPTSTRQAARSNDAQETIITGQVYTGYQSSVTVNGVAFAGEGIDGFVNDTSSGISGYTSDEINVINCISANDLPMATSTSNGIICAKGNIKHTGLISNNHFITSANQAGHNFLIFRSADGVEIKENYISSLNETDNLHSIWLSTVNASYTAQSYCDAFDVNIHHNNLNRTINVDCLGQVNSASLKINNNSLHSQSGETGQNIVLFQSFVSNSGKTFTVPFNQTTIEITGNTFATLGDTKNATGIYLQPDKITTDFAKFDISGNTFDNANGGFNYAILNRSNYVLTATGCTFTGFKYNFGSAVDLMPGGSIGRNYPFDSLTESNVVIPADAMFNGQRADYVESGVTFADVITSVDSVSKTAYDVCQNSYYVFDTTAHTMVKATLSDGSVYYNGVPVSSGKVSFTAQLTTVDGTPIGDEYTVNIVRDLLAVSVNETTKMETMDPSDASYNPAKPYAAYFEGQIVASPEYLAEFVNNADMKILDYGMYYANDVDAINNTSGYNAEGYYIKDGKKVGQIKSYAADANGLSKVYQVYSFRFKFIAPEKYRYGKMYLTYSVAGQVYTVYSDMVTLYSGTTGE